MDFQKAMDEIHQATDAHLERIVVAAARARASIAAGLKILELEVDVIAAELGGSRERRQQLIMVRIADSKEKMELVKRVGAAAIAELHRRCGLD